MPPYALFPVLVIILPLQPRGFEQLEFLGSAIVCQRRGGSIADEENCVGNVGFVPGLETPVADHTSTVLVPRRSWGCVTPPCRQGKLAKSKAMSHRTLTGQLSRHLATLEAALADAERIALSTPNLRATPNEDSGSHIESRRAELDRREASLTQRERLVQRQLEILELGRTRLNRSKECLKRAMARFRSLTARKGNELAGREDRLEVARTELIEARRELAREKIWLRAALRSSIQRRRRMDEG